MLSTGDEDLLPAQGVVDGVKLVTDPVRVRPVPAIHRHANDAVLVTHVGGLACGHRRRVVPGRKDQLAVRQGGDVIDFFLVELVDEIEVLVGFAEMRLKHVTSSVLGS